MPSGWVSWGEHHPQVGSSCNEGFKPPQDLDMARKVKAALDDAYAKGKAP